MATGTVKWFDRDGVGYGFIAQHAGGKDMFVHMRDVGASGLRTLSEGQHVRYEPTMSRGRICATGLSILDPDDPAIPGNSNGGEAGGSEFSLATFDRKKGTVKFFHEDQWGFITPDGEGADVFVYISDVKRAGLGNLKKGDRLSYELRRGRGKIWAEKLKRE